MNEVIKITKSQLIADVESGMKRTDIAEKYNLPLNQVQKLMKIAGLKTKRASSPKFIFEDDTIQENIPEMEVEVVNFEEVNTATGEILS